jgi:hypothetical protein
MGNLMMFIILLSLSIVCGFLAKRNQDEGNPSAFSWFISGWCGFAAFMELTKLIAFLILNQN